MRAIAEGVRTLGASITGAGVSIYFLMDDEIGRLLLVSGGFCWAIGLAVFAVGAWWRTR